MSWHSEAATVKFRLTYVDWTTKEVELQTARSEMYRGARKRELVGMPECKLKWKLSASLEQLQAAQLSLELDIGWRHPDIR